MPIIKNEIGKQYGTFKVLSKDESKKSGRTYWICECQKCKTIKSISGTHLRKGEAICTSCKDKEKYSSEIGKKYGQLTVIDFAYKSKDRHYYWKCKCSCGNVEDISGTELHQKTRTKCKNCNKKPQYIDEIGKRFGKLTVLEYSKEKSFKNAVWKCQCDCGNIIYVPGIKLRYGQCSCGCEKSKGELKINQLLSENNIKYKTQISFPDCLDKKELRFDFGVYDNNDILQYLIEFDGIQHFDKSKGWYLEEEEFYKAIKRDQLKDQYCKEHNIPLLRIPYTKYETLTIEDLLL